MELVGREYNFHIKEKDLIEWIERENPTVKIKEIIIVDHCWSESSDPKEREKNRYVMVVVNAKEVIISEYEICKSCGAQYKKYPALEDTGQCAACYGG